MTFSHGLIPNTKIIKSPFNGTYIRNTVDTSAAFATIFPAPGALKVQFAAAANGQYIYQIVLPVTTEYIISLILQYSARSMYVAIQ